MCINHETLIILRIKSIDCVNGSSITCDIWLQLSQFSEFRLVICLRNHLTLYVPTTLSDFMKREKYVFKYGLLRNSQIYEQGYLFGQSKYYNSLLNSSTQLSALIRRNKYTCDPKFKARTYKTCVRPILAYAIETRADNIETERALREPEIKVFRAISGKTRRDPVWTTVSERNSRSRIYLTGDIPEGTRIIIYQLALRSTKKDNRNTQNQNGPEWNFFLNNTKCA